MVHKKVLSMAIIAIVIMISAMVVAGCASPTPPPGPAVTPTPIPVPKTDLTVFAAASLSSAFNQTKAQFEVLHPEANIVYNFDSSGTLQTQLQQGAYADVFASAATSNTDALKAAGLMDNPSVANFAKNKLAIIVPAGNPANVTDLTDLDKFGLKLVVCANTVPCGKYTIQLLQKLANTSGYGADYADKVTANEVSKEPSVNFAVSKIALGEGDAALVYVSDVPAAYQGRVKMIAIPDSLNVLATYPIGVLQESKNPDLARAFVDYVTSTDGKAIMAKYGFTPA